MKTKMWTCHHLDLSSPEENGHLNGRSDDELICFITRGLITEFTEITSVARQAEPGWARVASGLRRSGRGVGDDPAAAMMASQSSHSNIFIFIRNIFHSSFARKDKIFSFILLYLNIT